MGVDGVYFLMVPLTSGLKIGDVLIRFMTRWHFSRCPFGGSLVIGVYWRIYAQGDIYAR